MCKNINRTNTNNGEEDEIQSIVMLREDYQVYEVISFLFLFQKKMGKIWQKKKFFFTVKIVIK